MIRSVKFKLAALITGAVVLAGLVLEFYHYRNAKELMLEAAERRGRTVAESLAFNAYTGVYAQSGDPIQPLLEGVLNDKEVIYVRVVALAEDPKTGKTVAQVLVSEESAAAKGRLVLEPLTDAALARGGAEGEAFERGGLRFLDVAAPVEEQSADLGGFGLEGTAPTTSGLKKRIGFVQIGYDLEPVYAQSRSFAAYSILILLVIVAVGVGFGLIIATSFVSPLRSIVDSSKRVAHGDLSQLLTHRADAQDELGELIRSFNQMVLDLRRSRGEIDEYNKNLAGKVEERTQEVERAYANLKTSQEAQKNYSEVLRTFNETADVDGVLREGLKGLAGFTGAAIGAVHVWDERDRKFHVSATQGLARQALTAFGIGEGLGGRCAAERRFILVEGLADDATWAVKTFAGDIRPRALLAAPIIYRDEVLGVLEIGTVGSFDSERLRLLVDLIAQFAIALSNVIANERTRQLAQTLQAKGRELEQQNRTLSEQSAALQRQQRELDEKNKDLERASKLKSEFLANMSHELRTPMNSIIGYTDLVLNRAAEALDPRHKKNLDKVLANAQHLLSLINGILDLSKIEAGKMELFLEEFDLQPLLESTASMAEVLIKGKPVKLVQKIAPELPRMKTDKTKLRQIVLNLLSNACKFTENGNVTLIAEPIDGRRKGDPNRLLKIEVQDSGIGIADKDLPIIFEEFRQVDGSSTRKYGGTGLGLAIVKKMVILMGGEITVRSELGQGSIFTIVLPLGEAAAADVAARAEAAEAKVQAERARDREILRTESTAAVAAATTTAATDVDLTKKTVLVVDDEPDSVILVRENLAGHPYRVLSAFTAEEGLRMAIKNKPFAILLDIMMPDKDGWDLIRDLKANAETAGIPIVILSIVDNKPLGFSLGATDYLLKPIDRDALVQSLTRISIRPVKEIMVVDDDEGVREILDDMLKREGYEVSLAKNGVEAIASLGKKMPDLVILDLMMPEMDGFEVVRQMRSHVDWKDVPVLICTAKELTQMERADLMRSVSRIVEKGSMQRDILLGELGTALRNIEAQMVARAAGQAAGKRAASG